MYFVKTYYQISKTIEAYFSCKRHIPSKKGPFDFSQIQPVDFPVKCKECAK